MTAAPFPSEGASARLHMLPAGVGHPACWAVLVVVPPVEAIPESLLRPGGASTLLTHDRGVTWPDAAGEQLAAEALRRGGVVALVFASRWDALDCKARIGGDAA